MTDDSVAGPARLMIVTQAIVEEAGRQGLAEVLAGRGFNPMAMARTAIQAADGDVVAFPGRK